MRGRRSVPILSALSLSMLLVLAGCGGTSGSNGTGATMTVRPAAVRPHITILADDYRFVLPQQIPTGWVDVTLHNAGSVGHQIAFAKLNDVSFTAFKAAAVTTNLGALSGVDFVGGPNNVDPGKSVTATLRFDKGEYGVACFIPDVKSRKPHAARGMVGEVNAAPTSASVDETPQVDAGSVTLSEFAFLPDASFTGNGTVEIKNSGTQVHELTIEKEKDGTTFLDAKKYLLPPAGHPASGVPAPITDAGGVVAVGPGRSVFQTMALTPGRYVFVCFFPDPGRHGIAHAAEGMLQEVTIR